MSETAEEAATTEAEVQLFEVSMAPFEDMTGWQVYVLANSIGEALDSATDMYPYRIAAPIVVRHLPTIKAGAEYT